MLVPVPGGGWSRPCILRAAAYAYCTSRDRTMKEGLKFSCTMTASGAPPAGRGRANGREVATRRPSSWEEPITHSLCRCRCSWTTWLLNAAEEDTLASRWPRTNTCFLRVLISAERVQLSSAPRPVMRSRSARCGADQNFTARSMSSARPDSCVPCIELHSDAGTLTSSSASVG